MGRPRKLYFGSWDGYPDCVYRCVARMHRKSVSDVMIYNREANGDVVFLDRWDPGLDVASIESMLKRVRGYRYLYVSAPSHSSRLRTRWLTSSSDFDQAL